MSVAHRLPAALVSHQRSIGEVDGRSKFDWSTLKELYIALKECNPDMTQNELILELQREYEDHFNKASPGLTTIQSTLKTWPSPAHLPINLTGQTPADGPARYT